MLKSKGFALKKLFLPHISIRKDRLNRLFIRLATCQVLPASKSFISISLLISFLLS